MPSLRIPISTYRLQFNHCFTFKQALACIAYFHELGISDLYASPIMKATPGSLHGYDVLDPCQLNPEIGNEEVLEELVKALKESGMGLILDIVPNHTNISSADNKWWQDVLENGPSSLYANFFNILWDPPKPELKNKVLLAVLDQQYGKVIEGQELKLGYEAGSFFVEYKMRRFPINPATWPAILKDVIEQLLPNLDQQDPNLLELQSILTGIEHLPVTGKERDIEKSKERAREKEIIKKRLNTLVEESSIVGEAIKDVLNIFNGRKEDPHSFDRLEQLLNDQAYRLSFWRVTNDEINYRRFFDVNELVSMRIEDEEVFDAMHELLLKYVKKEWITGFRIDHVDGLFDPQQYFFRLQKACALALNENYKQVGCNFYVIVEKILGEGEKLRPQWLVFGTSGYDYLNFLNGVFVVSESQGIIKQIYEDFIHQQNEMTEVIYVCKKLILFVSMSSELHILARHLEKVSEQHRWSRDFTFETLRSALREVIACFPVYRTYIRLEDTKVYEEDRQYIEIAIQNAKRMNPVTDPSVFEFIENVLLLEDPPGLTEEQIDFRRKFVMYFQQLTGPVNAKGAEDTAFYRYYPLISLNEVGMDPKDFGTELQLFHQRNQERFQTWPHTLLATSTHDTKRSEDVRARINVLSEIPEEWGKALRQWNQMNRASKILVKNREVPDHNEEFLLYQTLIGTWPLYPMDASARTQYIDRIEKYMLKAIKEAKIHTSWIHANDGYENGLKEFIHCILDPSPENQFLKDFQAFITPIKIAGMLNSLSQILLKMTTPGIPDFYQGSELWEFQLVDPDNRHPVDYLYRQNLLNELKQKANEDIEALTASLMETPEDGRIKLYITWRVLNFRLQNPSLFHQGNYQPIGVKGEKAKHVIAFSRTHELKQMIVAAGRFYTSLLNSDVINPIGKVWKNTTLVFSSHLEGNYRDLLNGNFISIAKDQEISLEQIFTKFPFTILEKI